MQALKLCIVSVKYYLMKDPETIHVIAPNKQIIIRFL